MNSRFRKILIFTAHASGGLLVVSGLLQSAGLLPTGLTDFLTQLFIHVRVCETDCSLNGLGEGGRVLGMLSILAGVMLALSTRYDLSIKNFINRYDLFMWRGIVAIMTGIFLPLLAYIKFFSKDTLEHVHCAWLIKNGLLPYLDFFQNHHPLLWIVLAPALTISPEKAVVLVYLRFFQAAGVLTVLWLTFRLARDLSPSPDIPWLALVLLVTMPCFFLAAVDVRPDLWQVILQLMSILSFMRFLGDRKRASLGWCGVWAGLAFLFLQKAIFLFVGYFLTMIWLAARRHIARSAIFWFTAFFSLPVLVFLGVLAQQGMLPDYLVNAWHFNLFHLNLHVQLRPGGLFPFAILVKRLSTIPISTTSPGLNVPFALDQFFWAMAVGACAYTLVRKEAGIKIKSVAILGLILWLPVGLLRIPFSQYLLPSLPLLAVTIAWAVDRLRTRRLFPRAFLAGLMLLFSVSALIVYSRYIFLYPSNTIQRRRIDYVLAHSRPDDHIYDGNNQFNVFRPDLHYFWHYFDWSMMHRRGLNIYNQITDNRFGDYDICGLVNKYRPPFVSDWGLHLPACGLEQEYMPTEFEGLYMRNDIQTHPAARDRGRAP